MSGFNLSFRIQGQVYHLIGSIVLTEGEPPKFAQIDDRESEVATRTAIVDGLKPDVIRDVNQLLHDSNHYVEMFKVGKDIFEQEILQMLKLLLIRPKSPQVNTPGGTIDLLVMR